MSIKINDFPSNVTNLEDWDDEEDNFCLIFSQNLKIIFLKLKTQELNSNKIKS
jgi:hypothetical protein